MTVRKIPLAEAFILWSKTYDKDFYNLYEKKFTDFLEFLRDSGISFFETNKEVKTKHD